MTKRTREMAARRVKLDKASTAAKAKKKYQFFFPTPTVLVTGKALVSEFGDRE